MTKETEIKKLLKSATKLQNDYNVPIFLAYYSKHGILPFGSENLVKKLQIDFKTESISDVNSWASTFDIDQDQINDGLRYDDQCDLLLKSLGDVLPERLPADLDLMVLTEVSPIVVKEILKSYWRRGGKCKQVEYGHPEFESEFWINSWPWNTVKQCFTSMPRTEYSGPENLNLTEFLKAVLKKD